MKEVPTVGSEVIIRIGHNLLPARVLAIRDTGSYQMRLEHSGNILWTRSIVEVLHKRTSGGLLDMAIQLLKENGPATAGELIYPHSRQLLVVTQTRRVNAQITPR